MSRSSPAHIPRKPIHHWILIQPLNVGDKGVAKINEGTPWLLKRQGRVTKGQTRIIMIRPNEAKP